MMNIVILTSIMNMIEQLDKKATLTNGDVLDIVSSIGDMSPSSTVPSTTLRRFDSFNRDSYEMTLSANMIHIFVLL